VSRHLSLETLSALLDSELSGAEADAAQAHVVECGECRERLEGLRLTVSKLHSLPPASPPAHVREALRRHLAVEQEVRRRLWALPGWHSRLATWPAMAAAVFLAAGCGLFLYAYLVRQSVPRPGAAPAEAPGGDWKATITYERPADEAEKLEANAGQPAPRPAGSRAEGKLEAGSTSRRSATGAAPAPAAAAAPSPERDDAVAKHAAAAPPESELVDARENAAGVGETLSVGAEERAPAAPATAPSPQLKAGGDAALRLGPGIEPPVKISGELPDFQSLRGLRFRQSLVIVDGTIGRDGILRDLSFQPRDLDPRVGDLLRRTLATWRFEPARKDGAPVALKYTLTVNIDVR
jgi:hypothetical protein